MTFTYTPDFPVEEKSEPYVRQIELAGYSQRALDGLHMRRDVWSLRFSARSNTDRNNIVAYLQTKAGTTPFQWTTPFGETAQFLCKSWSTSLDSCGLSTVSASFEITYVPGQTNLAATPIDSSAFTWIPDFPATRNQDTLVSSLKLGDGYNQNIAFGFNAQQDIWTLQFNNRTNAERDAIRTYLRGAARVSSFQWQTPLGNTARFICKDWTVRYEGFNNNSINLTFTRVFEPPSPLIYGYARGSSQFIGLTYTPGAAIYPGYAPGSSSQISLAFASGSAGTPAFAPGVNLQISVSLIQGAAIPPGYAPGANLQLTLAFAPGEPLVPGNGPGANLQITLALASGAATGSGGGGVATADSSAFWQYWKYNEADERILLYEDEPATPAAGDGAAYWSDWRPFDDEFFFYGEDAAASGDMPAYWNRWQSWTEDPPLIFEQST